MRVLSWDTFGMIDYDHIRGEIGAPDHIVDDRLRAPHDLFSPPELEFLISENDLETP